MYMYTERCKNTDVSNTLSIYTGKSSKYLVNTLCPVENLSDLHIL